MIHKNLKVAVSVVLLSGLAFANVFAQVAGVEPQSILPQSNITDNTANTEKMASSKSNGGLVSSSNPSKAKTSKNLKKPSTSSKTNN
jgi:hypothetical protein